MRIGKHLGQRPEVTSSTLVTAARPEKSARATPVNGITLSDRQLGENARSAAVLDGSDCPGLRQRWGTEPPDLRR